MKSKLLYTFAEIEHETQKDFDFFIDQLILENNRDELSDLKENLIMIRDEIDGIMKIDMDIRIHQVEEAEKKVEDRLIARVYQAMDDMKSNLKQI